MNSDNKSQKEINTISEEKNEFNLLYDKLNIDKKNEIKDFANWLVEKQQVK